MNGRRKIPVCGVGPFADHPEIEKTVSATTRAPREGEAEGVNYYYRSEEAFKQLIEAGEVLEYNYYNGNYYGTLRAEVERRIWRPASWCC